MAAGLHADATRTCAGSTSTRRPPSPTTELRRGERRARPARARVRAGRHRRLRRRPLLRRRGRLRQGRAGRHVHPHHVTNPGPEAATLHVLPTLWFRNTWSWGRDDRATRRCGPAGERDRRRRAPRARRRAGCPASGDARACCSPTTRPTPSGCSARRTPRRTSRTASTTTSCTGAPTVNPARRAPRPPPGTAWTSSPGETGDPARCGLSTGRRPQAPFGDELRRGPGRRGAPRPTRSTPRCSPPPVPAERRGAVQRQAFAGLLWTKQFYHFDVERWLDGRPGLAAAARPRRAGRNARLAAPRQHRRHLDARQVGVPLVRRLGPRVPLRRRWRRSTPSSPRTS